MTADALRKATIAAQRAAEKAVAARNGRDFTIRAAIATGWTHAAVAEATGLTRGRVNQIARGKR